LDLAIIGAPLLLYDDAEDVDYNPMSKIFNDDFMTSNETAYVNKRVLAEISAEEITPDARGHHGGA